MIFRNNIHQIYNNQFQTGTQRLNIQKQYKKLGEHLTENLTLAYRLKEKDNRHNTVLCICVIIYGNSKHTDGFPISIIPCSNCSCSCLQL